MRIPALKRICQKAAWLLGYELLRRDAMEEAFHDPEFDRLYEKCKEYTMTSKGKMRSLRDAVRYVAAARIPGDFVECGVWKGGSAMLIAYTLQEMGVTDRKIYLYDTFEGMSEPTENDYKFYTKAPALFRWKKEQKQEHNAWCFASLFEVKENMFRTGYPEDRIVFVKGKVEETIPQTIPEQVSLLRLDTDWYESSKHEIVHLFPRLAPKGVLVLDDYRYWAGQKRATDEYFAQTQTPILLIDNIGGTTVGIKVS